MTEKKFPSEVIKLPSNGYLYDEENVSSKGTLEIKYPTAREEDILTSKNLIRKNIVIDKFIESLIKKNVNLDSLIIGDKNAIIYASRILAYGTDYKVKIDCPKCNEVNTINVDLNDIDHKDVNLEEHFEKGINEFNFTLPASKIDIVGKLLTHKDEKEIRNTLKGMKKISKRTGRDFEITTRLKQIIKSIDGDSERKNINKFVDNEMLSRDSLALRKHLNKISPDLDSTIFFSCDNCGHEEVMDIPMDVNFFWPSGRV